MTFAVVGWFLALCIVLLLFISPALAGAANTYGRESSDLRHGPIGCADDRNAVLRFSLGRLTQRDDVGHGAMKDRAIRFGPVTSAKEQVEAVGEQVHGRPCPPALGDLETDIGWTLPWEDDRGPRVVPRVHAVRFQTFADKQVEVGHGVTRQVSQQFMVVEGVKGRSLADVAQLHVIHGSPETSQPREAGTSLYVQGQPRALFLGVESPTQAETFSDEFGLLFSGVPKPVGRALECVSEGGDCDGRQGRDGNPVGVRPFAEMPERDQSLVISGAIILRAAIAFGAYVIVYGQQLRGGKKRRNRHDKRE